MAKVIFVIFGIVVAAFLFFEPEEPPVEGSYHNEPYGFWVKFPDGWETKATLDDIDLWEIAAYNDYEDKDLAYSTCVKVVVEELAYKMRNDFYYDKAMESFRQLYQNISVESAEDYTVAGRDGKIITISYSFDGYPTKALWYIVTKGKRSYLVGGLAWPQDFEKHKSVFEEVIKSFRLD